MSAAVYFAQHGLGALITASMHPVGYAKVLIQAGYEPLPPKSAVSLFKKEMLIYPNIFQYIGHIKKVDGFWGLYRGVFPKVLSGVIGSIVQTKVSEKTKTIVKERDEFKDEEEPLLSWFQDCCIQNSKESVSRICGIVVSHPFQVVTFRCMLQFVGRETAYDSIFSSLQEIYKTDGILGFFSGLVPRLVGEILTLWITNFLARLVNKYLIEDKDMKAYTSAACGLVVSHFTYPFVLVSNIMAVNTSGLKAASPPLMPHYDNWIDCFSQLRSQNQLKRGASMFWRYYTGPAILLEGKLIPAPNVL